MQSTLPVVQANQLILRNGYTVNNLRSKLHGPRVLTAPLGVQIQENLNAIVSTQIFEENYPHSSLSGRTTNLKIKKNEVYLIQDGREIPLIRAAQQVSENSEKDLLTYHAKEIIRKARELKISRNSDHYLHPFPETMYLDPNSRDERIKALERELLEETEQNAQARKALQSATLERDSLAQEVTSLRDKLQLQTSEMANLQEENTFLKLEIQKLRTALKKCEDDLTEANLRVSRLTQELKLAEAKASAAEDRCNALYRELELQRSLFDEKRNQFQLTILSLRRELESSLETQNDQMRSLEKARQYQQLLENETRTKTSQLEALQEKNKALEEVVIEFEIVRLTLLKAQLEIGEKNLALERAYEALQQAQQKFEEELNRIHQRYQKQLELGALDITELQDTHRLEIEALKRDHQKALDELSATYKALEREKGDVTQELRSAHHQLDLAQIDRQRLEEIITLKKGELDLASSENKTLESEIAELKKVLIAKDLEFQKKLSELTSLLQIQELNAQRDLLLSQSELNRTKKELQDALSRESQTSVLTQEQTKKILRLEERIRNQERLLEERALALSHSQAKVLQFDELKETLFQAQLEIKRLKQEEQTLRTELQDALYLKEKALEREEALGNENSQLRASIQLLQTQIRQLQDQKLDIDQSALEEMQNQILAITQERKVMETQLQKQQHELYDLKRQLQERGHQIETLQSENELLRRENEEYKLHRAEYQESIRLRISLKQQLSRAEETISELQQELKKLEKQNEARTNQTRQVRETNSDLRAQISSLTEAHNNIEEEYRLDLEREKKQAQDKMAQLRAKIQELEKTIQDLNYQIESKDDEIAYLSSQNQSLREAFSEYQTNMTRKILELEDEITTFKRAAQQNKSQIETLQRSLEEKEDLISEYEEVFQTEASANDTLKALIPSMQALMEATGESNLDGIQTKIIELKNEVIQLKIRLKEQESSYQLVNNQCQRLIEERESFEREKASLKKTIEIQLNAIDEQNQRIATLLEELALAQRERDEAREEIRYISSDLRDARANLTHESEKAQRYFDELSALKIQSKVTQREINEKDVRIQELERDLTRKDQLLNDQNNKIYRLNIENEQLRLENNQLRERLARQVQEVEGLRRELLSRPPEEEVVETQSNIEEEEVTPEPSIQENLEAIRDVLGREAIKITIPAENAHRLQINKECTPHELTIEHTYQPTGSRKKAVKSATTKKGAQHQKAIQKLTTLNTEIGAAATAGNYDQHIIRKNSPLYRAYEQLAKPFEFLHNEEFKAALARIQEAKNDRTEPTEEDVRLIQENTTRAIQELIDSCFRSTSKTTEQGMEMYPILNLRCLLLYYKHYYPENSRGVPKEIQQKIQKIENLINALDMFFSFVEIPESASSSMGSTGEVEVTFFAPKK